MEAIDAAKLLHELKDTITTQLRTQGVVLHDDAGNRIRPHSGEEKRIVSNIARNVMQLVVLKLECQSPEIGSVP